MRVLAFDFGMHLQPGGADEPSEFGLACRIRRRPIVKTGAWRQLLIPPTEIDCGCDQSGVIRLWNSLKHQLERAVAQDLSGMPLYGPIIGCPPESLHRLREHPEFDHTDRTAGEKLAECRHRHPST